MHAACAVLFSARILLHTSRVSLAFLGFLCGDCTSSDLKKLSSPSKNTETIPAKIVAALIAVCILEDASPKTATLEQLPMTSWGHDDFRRSSLASATGIISSANATPILRKVRMRSTNLPYVALDLVPVIWASSSSVDSPLRRS